MFVFPTITAPAAFRRATADASAAGIRVPEALRRRGRPDARRVEEVLDGHRDFVEQPSVLAALHFPRRPLGGLLCACAVERDEGVEVPTQTFDALETGRESLDGRGAPLAKRLGQLGDAGVDVRPGR